MFKFIHGADFHLDSAFGALTAQQSAARRREAVRRGERAEAPDRGRSSPRQPPEGEEPVVPAPPAVRERLAALTREIRQERVE